MPIEVVCLRPEADFARVDAMPPPSLAVRYCGPADAAVPAHLATARGLVIPAVGPKLPAGLFENTALALVQVTGAGVDRIDPAAVKSRNIPVANIPGGSNNAIAEYVMTSASLLLRRLAWADAEIKAGRYAEWRARMLTANLRGLEDAQAGSLAGAAVDVYAVEPPPADNPLFALSGEARNRILLTPHIGRVTRQASTFLFRTAWQNVERVLVDGQAPLYRVY
jgi:phosphoglycerate dehydrogenase-like enzyme